MQELTARERMRKAISRVAVFFLLTVLCAVASQFLGMAEGWGPIASAVSSLAALICFALAAYNGVLVLKEHFMNTASTADRK